MDLSTPTTSLRQPSGRISQSAISGESQQQSPRTSIHHILDDYSLLHVFYCCRQPFVSDKNGIAEWRSSGYWWYTLAHVCQRWRNVILGSATHLGLSLFCTYGTPVADMLAHSPSLPLIVDYFWKGRQLTTEDEEGIILALKQHDRVRRVRLSNAVSIMQKLFVIMDEEYPNLEFLYITRAIEDRSTISIFPETFQAPKLHQLTLEGFALPIGSRLLTTAVGLVTLYLVMIHPSTYFYPNTLIQWVSLMPQLESLTIYFEVSVPRVERQLRHTTIIAPITLPNLHCFQFRGASTYLEALLPWITTPRLETLLIDFFNQLTFSVPRLLQFIGAARNLRIGSAVLTFYDTDVCVAASPHRDFEVPSLGISVICWHLDWQVSSMAQISNSLGQIFSTVERLILQHNVHTKSFGEHNEVERTEWRKLLRPFRNVKTLRMQSRLVKHLCRCLQLDDGELPLELLPELQALEYVGTRLTGETFTSFIDARRNAGRPVTLVHL